MIENMHQKKSIIKKKMKIYYKKSKIKDEVYVKAPSLIFINK